MTQQTKNYGKRFGAIAREFRRYGYDSQDDPTTATQKQEMRRATWLAWSHIIMEDLGALRNLARTQRPATLGADADVWRAIDSVRAQRASQEDKETVRDLNEWRSDVLNQESRAASQLNSLLRVLHTFEHVGESGPEMSRLKAFMFEQYGLRLDERVDDDGGRALSERHVRDFHLLPTWIRTMTKPHGGNFTPPPTDTRNWQDNDK